MEELAGQLLSFSDEPERIPELEQTMEDLDLFDLLGSLDPRLDREKALSFARAYVTCDPQEIRERSGLIGDLSSVSSASALLRGICLIQNLEEEKSRFDAAASRLENLLYARRRLQAYVSAVQYWNRLLSAKAPENPSERFQALCAFFASLSSAAEFATFEKALVQLDEAMPLPHYVSVGMNVREDGEPLEMTVLGTSGHTDLSRTPEFSVDPQDDAAQDDDLNALLGFSDPSAPSRSLGPQIRYSRKLYGSHFDEYIARNLEKQWKVPLSHAERILTETLGRSMEIPNASRLLGLRRVLSFYQTGVLAHEAFAGTGCALTRPDPNGEMLIEAQGAFYPDFILHSQSVQCNDISLSEGSAILLTGANHSGKTSYLKTIGQSLFLAQLGFYVPASAMRFHPVPHLYTLFSAGEDRSMESSRMGVEIRKLSTIVQDARAGDLVLLNEPMTSTNPVEAVSICAGLIRHFLETGLSSIMVTHLYDVYYLMKAKLTPGQFAKVRSLITESALDKESGRVTHTYHILEHEPLGNSYARETAVSYGITLDQMIADPVKREAAAQYLDALDAGSVYEGGEGHGLSDKR